MPGTPASATRSFVLPLIFKASHSCSPLQGHIQPPSLTPDSDPGVLTWWLSCPVLLAEGGLGGGASSREPALVETLLSCPGWTARVQVA